RAGLRGRTWAVPPAASLSGPGPGQYRRRDRGREGIRWPLTEHTETGPGRAYPLGASYDGGGTNFSLFSEAADAVDLCLFGDDGTEQRVRLGEIDASRCHAHPPSVGPRAPDGYRDDGWLASWRCPSFD